MKTIRSYLEALEQDGQGQIPSQYIYDGFSAATRSELEAKGVHSYQGKVRELARHDQDLWIYHTDRLSAFDRYIAMVPFKGAILAKISEFWLGRAAEIVSTHFVSCPHDRVIVAEAMEPIKAEVIVRGYMTGSMARAYQKGERVFCGEQLVDGLKEFQQLPENIITPTTKAEAYEHDEDTTPEEMVQRGIVTAEEWQTIRKMALNLFAEGQKVYADRGWILVDTKYEFGRTSKGEIKLIDEIHTPDSSRLWKADSYNQRLANGEAPEMLDKEIVRRYLMEQGFKGEGAVPEVPTDLLVHLAKVYLDVAEALVAEPLTVDLEQPLPLPQA